MWGVILALMAAVCWGLAPVAAKIALDQVSPVVGMSVRSLVAACLVSLWLVATGHYRLFSEVGLRPIAWLIIEAVLATVVGDALYFYALQHGHAGQVSLILASAPLITLMTTVWLLGEPVSSIKLVGAVMVIAGILLISV